MSHTQFTSTKTDWPFGFRPLTPLLGAEISGVNLTEEMTPEVLAGIHKAFLPVLLFPPQDVPPFTLGTEIVDEQQVCATTCVKIRDNI